MSAAIDYPVLPALARSRWRRASPRCLRRLAICSLLVAALWVDMAGAFYFTDIGDRLGI